jgi:hypothetical protein
LMRHINGVYAHAFNRRHRKVGHLFQGRFKAILVDRDAYLLEVCRYVDLNPVRARTVRKPHAGRGQVIGRTWDKLIKRLQLLHFASSQAAPLCIRPWPESALL